MTLIKPCTLMGGLLAASAAKADAYANAVENMADDARHLRHAEGAECPDCGSRDTESNGSTEFRCCKCDHRWGFEGGRNGEQYGF